METHNTLYHLLAFDIGATSGRSILGQLTGGRLQLDEITRFANPITTICGKDYWNIYSLYNSITEGIQKAFRMVSVDSIGIDTWGVDFVYLSARGDVLGLPRSYRDPYTWSVYEEYFNSVMPRPEVYNLTGIQILNFNSLFQLYAAGREDSDLIRLSRQILFMPDALAYLLTGKKCCEYTIASTSQLIDPLSKTIVGRLLEPIGLDESWFSEIIFPGTILGNLHTSLASAFSVPQIPVVTVAGHDTASAIAAIPAEDEYFAYISSGTWSLMGIETCHPIITRESYEMNFTNEGGVGGTIRFLKNITGMWLLEECRREWERAGRTYTYQQIVELSATAQPFACLIDPDDARFSHPASMTSAIRDYCLATGQQPPETDAGYMRCIFESLALKYRHVLDCLMKMSPFPIRRLHVIGGGSKNDLLNQMAANATGLPVIAGPCEATAIGNIMVQAMGLGVAQSLQEIRKVVKHSFPTQSFYPQNNEQWQQAYRKFQWVLQHNK